jgi:hypothetical protein
MKLERAIELQSQTVTRLRDVISSARIFKSTQETLLQERERVFGYLPKTTPSHVHVFCRGYMQALMDSFWNKDLVYGGHINNVFVSNVRERDDYYEKHGIEPCQFGEAKELGFYWASDTTRPYFISEKLNSKAAHDKIAADMKIKIAANK